MEEEPALEPLASVIPRYGEPMECEDAASEHFQSDDAAFQQSGSPFSSTFDATALPGDIGHPSPLDPGLPDSQPTRNGVERELPLVWSLRGSGREMRLRLPVRWFLDDGVHCSYHPCASP